MERFGKSSGRLLLAGLLIVALASAVLLWPAASHSAKKKGKAKTGVVIPPSTVYKDKVLRKKIVKLRPVMVRVQTACTAKFPAADFRFLTTTETNVGGIGLWPNPMQEAPVNRYLGVFARVRLPEPGTGRAFSDSENGRIMTVFDAYGKDLVAILSQELAALPDPQIEGAALVLIYGKRALDDPGFETDAEGLLLFMPRDPMAEFAALRLRLSDLLNQSDRATVFKGAEDLTRLRMKVLKP